MEHCCEFLDDCPMFALFNRAVKDINRTMYCYGDFGNCKRRQRQMAGESVPSELMPSGSLLSLDAERPRTII